MSGTAKTLSALLTEVGGVYASGQADGAITPTRVLTWEQDLLATAVPALTTVSAAGTTQANATALTSFISNVTAASAGQGVGLLAYTAAPSVEQVVANVGGITFAVYPPSGVVIGPRPANQPVLVPPGGTTKFIINSSSQGEIVSSVIPPAAPGVPCVTGGWMSATAGYKSQTPPWVQKMKNNTDVVDRSGVLPSGPTTTPLGLTKPAYLASVTDPYYGTKITRVTGDPGTAMLNVASGVWSSVVRHHYSTDQAWNCDESILHLANGDPDLPETVATSAATAIGSAVLTFTTTANTVGMTPGSKVSDSTHAAAIPAGTTVLSITGTTVTLSANVVSPGVSSGDSIVFADCGVPAGGTSIFLDGQSYVPLFSAYPPGDDPRWHPTNPNLMYYVSSGVLYTWVPQTGVSTAVNTFTGYTSLQIGGGHGCVTWKPGSEAAPLVPMTALNGSSASVAFVWDFSTSTKSVDIPVYSGAAAPWAGVDVSYSGTYVVCVDQNDILYFFNRSTGALVGGPYGSGTSGQPSHYDIAVDEAGNDCIIGVDKVSGSNVGRVCKRILSSGALSYLTPASPNNFAVHTSAQGYQYPGWGASSYYGATEGAGSYPLYLGEIVCYPLDGSSNPYRICHTFNQENPTDYYDEPQVSWSPSGTRFIWNSNWGNPNGNTRPVQQYVCDLR